MVDRRGVDHTVNWAITVSKENCENVPKNIKSNNWMKWPWLKIFLLRLACPVFLSQPKKATTSNFFTFSSVRHHFSCQGMSLGKFRMIIDHFHRKVPFLFPGDVSRALPHDQRSFSSLWKSKMIFKKFQIKQKVNLCFPKGFPHSFLHPLYHVTLYSEKKID